MSIFSEHLEKSITESGMTEKQLAGMSGFTRSYIALMKNGQRVSPDTDKIIKLFNALKLPPYEYKELWAEYVRARMGESAYERNLAVIDFFESFGHISNTVIKSFYRHEISEIRTVDNHMDLEYLIKAVIEQETLKENGFLHIIMQADVPVLTKLLPNASKNNKNMKIDHILCLGNYSGNEFEKKQLYNIKMLKALMPVAIFGNSENYRLHYYYDSVVSRFNTGSLMPYMILTSDCVITMNTDMNKGVIFREKEIIAIYEELFQENLRGCHLMLQPVESMTDMMAYYSDAEVMKDTVYTIAQQPCFGVLQVEELVKKYYTGGYDRDARYMESMLRKNGEAVREGAIKNISLCTREGLRRFAYEGILDEIPREIYHQIQKKDRISMLRKMLNLIEQEKYEVYLFDETWIRFPKELFVTVFGFVDATIMYLSEKEKIRFALKEMSLTKTLYAFFQEFMKNPQVECIESAAGFIRNLIVELEEDKK